MIAEVDVFLDKAPKWKAEMEQLRFIALDCLLTEEVKWKKPCYTYQKNNIIIIQDFKDYCALLFFKGALLTDSENVLSKIGDTQSARQIKFTSIERIVELEPVIKACIFEAIEVEKAGLKIERKDVSEYVLPAEFEQKLKEMPELADAFSKLTPGRRKAYAIHFAEPVQSQTRISRIEKMIPRILNSKGMTDCVCGWSHKKPGCDGTHKHLQ